MPRDGVIEKAKADLDKFGKSAEKDAMFGALGALVGTVAVPYAPQLPLGAWAKISNVLYGLALIALGAWINHDGIGFFFVGIGVAFLVDGLVRVFVPAVTTSSGFAPDVAAWSYKAPMATMYNSTQVNLG